MMFESCFEVFRPQTEEPLLLWMQKRFHTVDSGTPRLWDHFSTPHIGAPGGPAEAYQDPKVRELNLMFCARAAKTTICLAGMLFTSHTAPAPMMTCNATRKLVKEMVTDRVWKMADAAGVFDPLPPMKARGSEKVRLPNCTWHTGYAENPRSLADKSAKVLHKGEVEKWAWKKGTKEAHPSQLADERAMEYPDRKILNESTPAIAETSLIEPAFLRGWGCHFHVPCPHCQKYQRLNLGKGEPGGIRFDKQQGKRNPQLAYATARYVCQFCEKEIGEDDRPLMMRRGVWVPAGCGVNHAAAAALFEGLAPGETHHRELHKRDDDGLITVTRADGSTYTTAPYRWRGWAHASWITGTPSRDGEIASYQISRLYILAYGWRDIAKKWVEVQAKPGALQNFINSWLGESFREKKKTEEWESLARKLICDVPQKIVPKQASIVTVGIDRQQSHFVLDAIAWAPPGRLPWLIDYLYLETLDQVRAYLLSKFPHQDAGPEVPISRALIDVNFHPAGEDGSTIHAWIRETNAMAAQAGLPLRVIACRGANKPLNAAYRESKMGEDSHCPGGLLVEVDHPFTQDWLNKLLFGNVLDEPEHLGPAEARPISETDVRLRLYEAPPTDHQDLLIQLLNDEGVDEVQKRTNNTQRVWRRIDSNVPNDHRDATRYGMAAVLHATRNGPIVSRGQRVFEDQQIARPKPEGRRRFSTTDGRPWFVGNRT